MSEFPVNNETAGGAWYALRRTLVPWDFDNQLEDLIKNAKEFKIDEVILVIDTEEFSHGHPSIQWVDDYQKKLFRAKARLKKEGIVYSLNPWVTVGHNDRGRDVRKDFPGASMMTGHRGEKAKAQFCPLDKVWREYIEYIWGKYAETGPHVIWVDDDIRTFNHEPVDYGCFCSEHLRLFSERLGEKISREELIDAIFKPGEPHPWRKEWLNLQREVMLDTLGFIRKTVQSISPDTRMGLMSSGPENHVMDGRDWEKTGKVFAGDNPLYSRAPLGNYWEASLRGFYYTARQIRATRACIPADAVEQGEVENWWFSAYSKSVSFTETQIGINLLLGSDGLTLNLFDHLGGLLGDYRSFGNMLSERKPFFNAIAQRCRGKAPCGGFGILHHDDNAMYRKLKNNSADNPMTLAEDGHYWDSFLESLGFSTTWDKYENNVYAVSSQVLRAFGDNEILKLLSGGLLLDLGALEVIKERGFEEYTGVILKDIIPRNSWKNLAAEEWHNTDSGGSAGRYISMTFPFLATSPDIGLSEAQKDTEVISRLVNIEREEIAPFLTVCKNNLGGIVAVFPVRLEAEHGALLNPVRKKQFSVLADILYKGKTPLEVTAGESGVYPLPVLRDFDNYTIAAAYNLSLDSWENVQFNLYSGGRSAERIEILNEEGVWIAAEPEIHKEREKLIITINKPVPSLMPVILYIRWSD